MAPDYHSDSADSLKEVPTDKSLNLSARSVPLDSSMKPVKKKRVKKKKKEVIVHSDDELNSTTMFTLNETAKLKRDGSIDFTQKYDQLPLTPTNLRKNYAQNEKKDDVPPLDFSKLRGSHESVSFMPYSATFRSTDTVATDRLLPALREDKMQSTLQPVADTEV